MRGCGCAYFALYILQELKKAYKEIDIDEVEDLYDDMEDMLTEANEIQDVMGRQYEYFFFSGNSFFFP